MTVDDRKIDLLFVTIIIAVIVAFCAPLFKQITLISMNDEWLSAYAFNYFSRLSILDYHQLPLWSPYSGGGVAIIGHSYQGFINPLFIFVLIFGEVIGLKVAVFIIYLAAALGMYYLTRAVFNFHPFAALFSSLVFTLSGYLPSFLKDGNYFHTYIYFLPWALAFFLKAVHSNRAKVKYITLSSIFLGLILLQAGFFFIVASGFMLLLALLSTIAFNSKERKIKLDSRYLKIGLIVILLSVAVCAVKLIPMLNLINSKVAPVQSEYEDDYRTISDISIRLGWPLSWQGLYRSLFEKHFTGQLPTYYLGFIAVIFSLFALILRPRENFKWGFTFVVFLFLSMGPLAPINLFKLIWSAHRYVHFIYKQNKYFSIGIVFVIAILSGRLLAYLFQHKFNNKLIRNTIIILSCAASLIALTDLFNTNIYFHKDIFTQTSSVLEKQKDFFQIYIKNVPDREQINNHQYFYLLQNIGLINWHSNILLKESASPKYFTTISNWRDFKSMELNPEYKGEFYFLDQRNRVQCSFFSPNELIFDVDLERPDTLVINQNYSPGWQISLGEKCNYQGLLAVKINKSGKYRLRFYYFPLDFWCGAGISLITLISLGILLIKNEANR